MFNHLEYDTDSLKEEYDRDVAKGIDTAIPSNYYPNDDPDQQPINHWRSHAHLFFGNWIGEIFSSQPTLAVRRSLSSVVDYDAERSEGDKFDTVMVHLGQTPNSDNRACAPPIDASSLVLFANAECIRET